MWNPKPTYPPKNSPSTDPLVETPRPPENPATARESSMAARVTTLPSQNVSVIGKSITVTGDITGSEPLHVEGSVKGTIRLESAYLNIGPAAKVQSSVEAREVVVRGSVTGNVNVTERIDIRSGGSLVGDVTAHSVSIEEGAFFKGSIDMRRSESARNNQAPNVAVSTSPKQVEPELANAAVSA
jgi:cytoskeletal protein CcmA (bactofilin family)